MTNETSSTPARHRSAHEDQRDTPGHPEDLALVRRCTQGDRRAWEELLRHHAPTLRNAALHTLRLRQITPSPDQLDDLVGDLVVELARRDFHKLRRYEGRSKLASWLKVVASNYTIDQLRRRRPTRSLDEEAGPGRALRDSLVDPAPGPEALLRRARLRAHLRDLMDRLPQEDQRFVELFYDEGLDFQAIAQQMQTTVGALYARKNRVRKKLLKMAQEAGLLEG
jgi:RNA polymerase sigma-70 factor (ECF subfamily)